MLKNLGDSGEDLAKVSDKLNQWHRSSAGFILSRSSIRSWYSLRDALNEAISHETFDKKQIEKLWEAKNRFRSNLRKDVDLLYEEESY